MLRISALFVIVALASNPAHAQSFDDSFGDYYYVENKDPFDDADRSFVMTQGKSGDAALAWKCASDGLSVLYNIGKYFGGDDDDEIVVRWRIDDNPPASRSYWGLGQDHEIAVMPDGTVDEFTNQTRQGASVAFRAIDPLDGETLTHEFSLTGLSRALQELPCASPTS